MRDVPDEDPETPAKPTSAPDAGAAAADAAPAPAPPEAGAARDGGETAPDGAAADGAPSDGADAADDDAPASRRRASEARPTPPPPERLEGAVEAVLLAAGEALSAERIRDLLGLPSALPVRDALEAIRARWRDARLPVEVQDVAGGHRVVTRPDYAEYVRRLWRRPAADRLSTSLLETLSIVAYKQPVARVEIERIRGVQCGEALRQLLERRLLKVAGRSDQPGRPLLYATTTRFLEVFGLASLDDLPNAKDLARL